MKSMSIGDKQFMHAFPCIYTVYIYIYIYIYIIFFITNIHICIFSTEGERGRKREDYDIRNFTLGCLVFYF